MPEKKGFHNDDMVLNIHDRSTPEHWVGLNLQYLFTTFRATMLVPILMGVDPGIALASSGLGTLVYLFTTERKIPAYLGGSFVFIAAMQLLMKADGCPAIVQRVVTTGLVYLVVALIIRKVSSARLDETLPPTVVDPAIMVIGLGLAADAATNTMYNQGTYGFKYIAVALITLGLTIFFNMWLRGFLGLIPILLGIISGYIVTLLLGIMDTKPIVDAAWFTAPNFEAPFLQYEPKLYLEAIITMALIASVTMTEHIGHLTVLNKLTKRNFFEEPGLHKTLTGDGLAQIVATFVGGPPVTSYSENVGVLAIIRAHSVFVIGGAAVSTVVLRFVGKLNALILNVPGPVVSGISFILFGVVTASGMKVLIENKIDSDKKKNLLIASIILIVRVGGLVFEVSTFTLSTMALATILGIALNLILPETSRNEKN